MFRQVIETSATPHITITECLGDLVVRGSAEQQISLRLRNGTDDANLEQEGETFTLEARADCRLTCPTRTTLTVRTVRGDLKINAVEGTIAVGTVYGDATLRAVGPTELEQVFGDLRARGVAGNLRAQQVGETRVYGVDGLFSVDQVSSDLRAEGLQGGLAAEQVGADVRVGPPFSPGSTYRVSAGSDLVVTIPADASLQLTLRAGGRIRSRVPGLVLEEEEEEIRGTIGAGEATLEAQAGGSITLRPVASEEEAMRGLEFDLVPNMEGLGAQIEAQIAEAMAEMEVRLEESLGHVDSERLRLRMERAAERARRKAEHAAERARLRVERAERRWQRVSGHRHGPLGAVTDEERMRVLKMVEEGKITPEQAAELLAALEGR